MEWEQIDYHTMRAKVFAGWLVRTFVADSVGSSVALCFLPDPNHEWEIKKD